MNKEAGPLIIAIIVPIILVSLMFLYINGYDITIYFRKIDIIYYIYKYLFRFIFIYIIFNY